MGQDSVKNGMFLVDVRSFFFFLLELGKEKKMEEENAGILLNLSKIWFALDSPFQLSKKFVLLWVLALNPKGF